MHLPTLRQLEFLCAIAAEGSFSKAASACYVTQPTLSSAIKELEGLLGVQLIEREARGASLTPAGVEAVRRARLILSDTSEFVMATQRAGSPLSGPFRLGAIPTVAPFILPSTLTAIRDAYPNLKLQLREDQTDRLIEALKTRQLDAAILALPWDMNGIDYMTLGDDEFFLATAKDDDLQKQTNLTMSALNSENLLLLDDGHCLRNHALSACKLPSMRDGTDVTATSLQTLVQMVAGGFGVTLLPKLAYDSGVAAGANIAIRSFDPPHIGRYIGIAWRAGSSRSDDARLIGEIVKKALDV